MANLKVEVAQVAQWGNVIIRFETVDGWDLHEITLPIEDAALLATAVRRAQQPRIVFHPFKSMFKGTN